ncbi:hypothetical protein IMZ48_40540 [Candidatus Bathyarchaeota archaeon]|nr:hypothetical protein [Candidatus Bathyarchaeota archaeon]
MAGDTAVGRWGRRWGPRLVQQRVLGRSWRSFEVAASSDAARVARGASPGSWGLSRGMFEKMDMEDGNGGVAAAPLMLSWGALRRLACASGAVCAGEVGRRVGVVSPWPSGRQSSAA